MVHVWHNLRHYPPLYMIVDTDVKVRHKHFSLLNSLQLIKPTHFYTKTKAQPSNVNIVILPRKSVIFCFIKKLEMTFP
jgi:hypothetical protein